MEIKVVPYMETWERDYKSETQKLKKIMGKQIVAIKHIGSTSVEGLAAKPIVDILLIVKDIAMLDRMQGDFEKIGYEYMGEFGLPGRRYMRKGGDQRTHQIHSYQFNTSTGEITRHIAFRDYLRRHKDVADEYASLKITLARLYPNSIEDYGDGKDAFIKKHEALALQEFWKRQAE